MGEWHRATHESSLANFSPGITAALKKHIGDYQLGSILSDVQMCVETRSEKIKKGLFGSAEAVLTAVILTPRWLLWTIQEGKGAVTAISARLADIVVVDYSKSSMAKLIADSGIEVTGEFTGVSHGGLSDQRGSIFIGLDAGEAARKFEDMLIKAVKDNK
jgi:hypothetical protein